MRKALVIPLILLLAAPHVVAQQQQPPPIEIRPEAPPGIGSMVQRLLNWLYWGAWITIFCAAIYGAVQWVMGDAEKGKRFLGGAIIGAVILAALTVLIPALVS
ncbi:MAG: hypothetical protein QW196_07000 [Sulfolobales archaeon]